MNDNLSEVFTASKIFIVCWIILMLGPSSVYTYAPVAALLAVISILSKQRTPAPLFIYLLLSTISVLSGALVTTKAEFDVAEAIKILLICFIFLEFTNTFKFNRVSVSVFLGRLFGINQLIIAIFVLVFLADYYSIGTTYVSQLKSLYYDGEAAKSYTRSVGLLSNPNQYGKLLTILLISQLLIYKKNPIIKHYKFIMNIVALAILIFATGSRTATLICILSITLYYSISFRRSSKLLIISMLLPIVIITISMSPEIDERAFDYQDVGSLTYKIATFFIILEQLTSLSAWHLLFGVGSFNPQTLDVALTQSGLYFGIDSDLGFIPKTYGMVGSIFVIGFIVRKLQKLNSPLFVYPLLLWILTSSLLFNVRTVMQIFLLLLLVSFVSGHQRLITK